ncbi:methyltransferase [Nocardioides sp. TRM66260-LWL]|uniref:class I SAM-dependent RNA methyltransferase n=1 Tax=Nocardioides sp. TRM66260-LWL TaxID=2874478 RepID=UPI001CC63A1F|nr:methyltransferase [Nocardioides sp. TRM66260-LWL]MBZ5733751.1 methyltransferase [Nocardioides sp. TRM66260-LWL]
MSREQRRAPGRRVNRPRADRGRSRVGERFEAEVGPIAHGGHCVVRLPEPEARVVFTRHCLPGERVVLEITEGSEGDRFWRADAVEVLDASPDRVQAPCPVAGPGGCGGCDLQHASLPAQRRLKAAVVAEQLRRLAGLELDVVVEPVGGDDPQLRRGLRWRTRQRYVDLGEGRKGLRKHRSHDVVEIDDCLITGAPSDHVVAGPSGEPVAFEVADDGFWQVHPSAPSVLVATVLEMLRPQPGERALDLYAGVGLFGRFLADAIGEPGRVVLVEADAAACRHAKRNVPGARVVAGAVEPVLAEQLDEPFDVVVLDPPREGARRAVCAAIADRAPRAIAYVACDPAALARDVAFLAEHGYRLTALRAFDLFPMTHHVECVALLER